jgi:hypothetical protein
MTGMEVLIVAPIAVGTGYGVGKMPCWKTWTGYAGLVIVAPIAVVAGVAVAEVVIDCISLSIGYAMARHR